MLVFGINAPRALAADMDLTANLPIVPAHDDGGWATVLAASGDAILAAHEADYLWSPDGGVTWTDIGLAASLTNITDCVFGTVGAGVVSTDCGWPGESAYSLASNAQVGSSWTDPDFGSVLDRLGSRVLVEASSQYEVVDLSTTPATVTTLSGPAQLLTEHAALNYSYAASGSAWTLTLTTVTGTGSAPLKVITGLSSEPDWDHSYNPWVAGDVVQYDDGNLTSPHHCYFRISDTSKGGCLAGFAPDWRTGNETGALTTSGGRTRWTQISASGWGASVIVDVPDSANLDWYVPSTGMPLVVNNAGPTPTLSRLNPDGTLTTPRILDWANDHVEAAATRVKSLSLTPTAVLGWDHRQGGGTASDATAWSRSVGSTIGSESTIGTGVSRASSVASAARWVIPTGENSNLGADFYDKGTKIRSDGGHLYDEYSPLQLSGPNLLLRYRLPNADDSQTVVENVKDGSRVSVSNAVGIFGSLVLTGDDSGKFKVQDASGASATISGQLKDPGTDSTSAAGIWGDWVGFTTYDTTDTWEDTEAAVAHNFRTGAEKTLPGYALSALGDGFAVVTAGGDPHTSLVWNFATGATTALAGSPDLSLGNGADVAAIDGNRVAYTDVAAGKLHIQTFGGLARSAPRNLGVVAASSFTPSTGQTWSADIDLTKPVNAGQLRLLNASGSVVRSIAVPASATGSLRGIRWDGRDDAGDPAPSGAYTFKLTNQATDATGAVVAVDGTDRALGGVTLVGPTLVAATPVIGGSALVNGSLTVTPGTWGPSGVRLAYQWLRDGQPIAGATGTSYVAVAGDAGHNISIRVTGSFFGASKSTTSAAVRIGTASFASAPAPTVSGTWFYGKTVTATAGTWSPAPDSIAFQWLRDGQPIDRSVGSSYKLGADDVGRQVSVRVIATKAGYGTAQTLSAAHIVGGTKFSKTAAAGISGTAKVGKSLTGKLGKFAPKPTKITYQWLRNGQPIVGAIKSKYELTKADLGAKVSLRITATKAGYFPVEKVSKSTKTVAPGDLSRGKVTVTGNKRVGATLTATTSKWSSGVTYHFQWFRNSAPIATATTKTYILTVTDKGTRLKVKVWTTKDGYNTSASRTSAETGKVSA